MNHDQCREKVCIICIGKASYPHKITPKLIELLKVHARNDFLIDDPAFPCGICNSCHSKIYLKERAPETTFLFVEPFVPNRQLILRSQGSCNCRICTVAKISGLSAKKIKKKRGRPSTISPAAPSKSTTICKECLTELYPGCTHDCSRKTKLDNLEKLLESPTKRTSRKLIDREKRKCNFEEPQQKIISISGENLSTIGNNMNLSIRKTNELAQNIRSATGCRTIIEPCSREKIHDDRHRLDEFFNYESILFVEEDSKNKTSRKFYEHAIVTKDINELVNTVIRFRKLQDTDVFVKVGMDGGGGFLKFCISIFDIKSPVSQLSDVAKKFKDSGVKKVLLVAISPEIQENYINVKKLWLEAGIHRLQYKYTIATDLKLINIILGLQNHSSLHPCAWCDVDKYNLDKKGEQRTFKSLINLYFDYADSNASKDRAKEYGNVIHPPIFDVEDHDTPVIHKVPPPELHLMLGPTNHLIDALCKLWPGCIAWLQSLNLCKAGYYGGTFEGNECRKILKKIGSLSERCPPEFYQLVDTLKLFDEVVKSCYGYELADNFLEKINEFKSAYLKLSNISVTPKVHAVFFHIPEFCLFAGRGLGSYSEQTAESLHSEFKKCWGNFLVKNTANSSYPERFLRAVQTFNSTHL